MSKSSEWAMSVEQDVSDEIDESTLDPNRNDEPTSEEWEEIKEGLSELIDD